MGGTTGQSLPDAAPATPLSRERQRRARKAESSTPEASLPLRAGPSVSPVSDMNAARCETSYCRQLLPVKGPRSESDRRRLLCKFARRRVVPAHATGHGSAGDRPPSLLSAVGVKPPLDANYQDGRHHGGTDGGRDIAALITRGEAERDVIRSQRARLEDAIRSWNACRPGHATRGCQPHGPAAQEAAWT
jgi:hypothetical protein